MGNFFASSPPKKDNDEEQDALDAQNPIPDDISIKAVDQLDEASLPDKPVLLDTIEQLAEMQQSPANEEAAKEVDPDQAEGAKKTDIPPSELRPSSAPQPNTVDGVSSSVFYLVNKTMQGRGLPNLKLVLTDDEGDLRGQGAVYCWREVIEAACPALIDAVSDDGVLFLDAIDDHPPPPASKKTIVRTPWPKEARDYFHAAASVAIEPGQDVPFPLIRTLSAPDVEPAHTKMTKGKVSRPKSVQQSGSGVRRPLETIRKGKTATARVWADLSSQPIAPLTPVVQPAESNVAADRFDERVIVSEPATPKEGRRFRALSFGATSARAQKWKKHLRIVSGAPEATGSVVDGAQSLATSALSTPAGTPLPSGMVSQQSQDGQRHRHGSQSSGGPKRPPSMASVSAGQVVHGELIAVTGCSFETLQALIFYLNTNQIAFTEKTSSSACTAGGKDVPVVLNDSPHLRAPPSFPTLLTVPMIAPKSAYSLSRQLRLNNLEARSFEEVRKRFDTDEILEDLLSPLGERFQVVREAMLDFVAKNWDTIRQSPRTATVLSRLAQGHYPAASAQLVQLWSLFDIR
ncbi:unnamed protein product [Jaminaea pallidilutea]